MYLRLIFKPHWLMILHLYISILGTVFSGALVLQAHQQEWFQLCLILLLLSLCANYLLLLCMDTATGCRLQFNDVFVPLGWDDIILPTSGESHMSSDIRRRRVCVVQIINPSVTYEKNVLHLLFFSTCPGPVLVIFYPLLPQSCHQAYYYQIES